MSTVEKVSPKRIWDMEPTDVMRFVITREQFETLLTALASGSAWGNRERSERFWKALEVLQTCYEDTNASQMVHALTKIAEFTKGRRNHEETMAHTYAESALKQNDEKDAL